MSAERNGPPERFHEDPIRGMVACHRRIERFLSIMITVKREAQGGSMTPDQQSSLDRALSFFRENAPWHVLDEEESLFPRIRLSRRAEMEEKQDCLTGLELEHAILQVCHMELDQSGKRWIRDGRLSRPDFQRFSEMLSKISVIYHHHLREEETIVYPLAHRLLQEPEFRSIGREMTARREVPFIHEMMANP